eukprot:Skav206645  [mRNA]  locus=scaffold5599:68209:70462:- [translate_table: standard]
MVQVSNTPPAVAGVDPARQALLSKLKAEESAQLESVRMATEAEVHPTGEGSRRCAHRVRVETWAETWGAMCDFAAPTTSVSANPKASRSSVDELLMTAARESANAPNRALKRRVRQRLHKKLGAILTLEEFERAKDSSRSGEPEEFGGWFGKSRRTILGLQGCITATSSFNLMIADLPKVYLVADLPKVSLVAGFQPSFPNLGSGWLANIFRQIQPPT